MPKRPALSGSSPEGTEKKKRDWYSTPPTTFHPLYPADSDWLVREALASWQKSAVNQNKFFSHGCFSSSLLWKTFHIAFVSPVLTVNLEHWFHDRAFVEYHNMEDDIGDYLEGGWRDNDEGPDFSDHWDCKNGKLVDFDMCDGAGKIWQMRMVWAEGGGAMEGFYGYYGKVFDRADSEKRRILFNINQGYQAETEFNRTADFTGFVDHENLKSVLDFIKKDKRNSLRNDFYCCDTRDERDDDEEEDEYCMDFLNQPSFMVAVALFAARTNIESLPIHWTSGTKIVTTQLRLLSKAATTGSIAFATALEEVCRSDDLCGIIASYVTDPYLVRRGYQTDVGIENDSSMNWYTKQLDWFGQAVRCHASGDDEGRKVAYYKFCEDIRKVEESMYNGPSFPSSEHIDVERVVELLQPLLLGLEHDTKVFPNQVAELKIT